MEYRVLGRTGVRVSAIALGTANFADPTPEDEAAQILHRAVDAGVNLIDTGNSYAKGEAERIIGRARGRGRGAGRTSAPAHDHGARAAGPGGAGHGAGKVGEDTEVERLP